MNSTSKAIESTIGTTRRVQPKLRMKKGKLESLACFLDPPREKMAEELQKRHEKYSKLLQPEVEPVNRSQPLIYVTFSYVAPVT